MSGHTPGPWEMTPTPRYLEIRDTTDDGILVAVVYGWREDEWETDANARLIAVSPRMLETLKRAHHYFASRLQQGGTITELHELLEATIAEATGEQG